MAKNQAAKLFQDDTNVNNDIVDVELSAIKKQRFRINGDQNKILELNVSDMTVGQRLRTAYKNLSDLMDEVTDAIPDNADEISEEQEDDIIAKLNNIDKKMQEQLDYIFNAPVSSVVCDEGCHLWDPVDGSLRYETIIETLAGLYETNLDAEFEKMKTKMNSKLQDHKKAVSKYHK